jgi:transcriptional regulator with XRE-family HTH domain
MAKKFSELRSRMTPEAQARASAKAAALRAEMPLQEIRQARGLSQKMLAEVLKVNQPAIAKMEKRTDAYISTLRSHIEAMGGKLEIIARFPEGSVKITKFSTLEEASVDQELSAESEKFTP